MLFHQELFHATPITTMQKISCVRVAKARLKRRDLTGVICDKKVPTKTKLLIYQTAIRPTVRYGFETWPTRAETRMVRWAMGGEPVGTPEK